MAVPDGKAQFNILIDVELDAEFDEALAIYGLQKAALGDALLRHALEDDQIEIAVQKHKARSDQLLRATRQAKRVEKEAESKEGEKVRKIRRPSSGGT